MIRLLVVLAVLASSLQAQDFRPLFDGRSLDGWVIMNGDDSTWVPRDGALVCSGKPTGVIRTDRMYENFVLEMEWRHMQPKGNAGLFVWSDPVPHPGVPFTRSVEVQVMDGVETPNYTSHGDIFSIWGATMVPDRPHPAGWQRCLPSQKRCRPSPEWNHYRVVCRDGRIKLAVNGKEVSGARAVSPSKGYICLESEGTECHFRNLRIRELPPSPTPLASSRVARRARGFRTLYDGVSLDGWRAGPGHDGHWQPKDWRLVYDGKGETLWSRELFEDFDLIVDWRLTDRSKKTARPIFLPDGSLKSGPDGKPLMVEVDDAGDSGIYLRGSEKSQLNIWCWPCGSGEIYGYRTDASQPADVRAGATPLVRADHAIGRWNRFEIAVRGERVTALLNGRLVIDDVRLPGMPKRGPIGLQSHGDPVEFANIFVAPR